MEVNDRIVPSENWGSNGVNIDNREFKVIEIFEDEVLVGDDDMQLMVYKNEVDVVKTSEQWNKEDTSGVIIMDPDGWDRQNYQYSFYEELITEQEYNIRKMWSTCLFNNRDSNGKII